MSDDNKAERFTLSRNFRRWSKQRLEKIFYSNESHICLKQDGIQLVRKYDDEDWSDEKFRVEKRVRPLGINIWMMVSYERGVERIKWTSEKPWINGEYYRETILAKYVLEDKELQVGSDYGGYF